MSKYLHEPRSRVWSQGSANSEDLNIGWEHMPTGIDDLSIILRPVNWLLSKKKKFYVNSFKSWGWTMLKSNNTFPSLWLLEKRWRVISGNCYRKYELYLKTRLTSRWCPKVQVKPSSCLLSIKSKRRPVSRLSIMPFSVKVRKTNHGPIINQVIDLQTTEHLTSISGKLENLVRSSLRSFILMSMSNNISKSPGPAFSKSEPTCGRKISRHCLHWSWKFLFTKDSGAILKIARKLGNDKVVKLPDSQTIEKLKNLFAKSRNFSIITATG